MKLNLIGSLGISFQLNSLGMLLALITFLVFGVSFLVAVNQFPSKTKLKRFYISSAVIFLATLGIFLAGDLFTLFIFFEIMSMTAYLWVIQNGDENAVKAGKSYIIYAVFSGLVLLTGIMILYYLTGDLNIINLNNNVNTDENEVLFFISCTLMLIGFGTKAGLFLLNDWLPKVYRFSPTPATAVFSGILSKTGVYGAIIVTVRIFGDNELFSAFVLILSVLTMLTGAVCAFVSNNLIQTIAYSSVSQLGFIFWGIALTSLLGEHNLYGALGTVFHTLNHSLIKLVLFCLSAVIYKRARTEDLNKIKGFGIDKPWLKITFAVSALALAGVPLFSGYVSKTLLHEAMVELIHLSHGNVILTVFEWLFLLSGGFTFAYMLKLYICIFVRKGYGQKFTGAYISKKAKLGLTAVTLLLLALGLAPNFLFAEIGEFVEHFMHTHYDHEIHYFTRVNLQGSAISIAIGLLLYLGIAEKTVASKSKGYTDYSVCSMTVSGKIYKPLMKIFGLVFSVILRIFDVATDICVVIINRLFYKSVKIPKSFTDGDENTHEHSDGIQITYSLSYSLLLFGVGLLFTLLYLLTLGSN